MCVCVSLTVFIIVFRKVIFCGCVASCYHAFSVNSFLMAAICYKYITRGCYELFANTNFYGGVRFQCCFFFTPFNLFNKSSYVSSKRSQRGFRKTTTWNVHHHNLYFQVNSYHPGNLAKKKITILLILQKRRSPQGGDRGGVGYFFFSYQKEGGNKKTQLPRISKQEEDLNPMIFAFILKDSFFFFVNVKCICRGLTSWRKL